MSETANPPDLNALARAVSFEEEALSDGTIYAYSKRWPIFVGFCEERGLCALPADPKTVAAFIEHMSAPYEPTYIQNIIKTVATVHTDRDFPSPNRGKSVRKAVRALRKEKGSRPRQATPINRPLLKAMIANLTAIIEAKRTAGENPLYELRDRALLAVGYDTLARGDELVALRIGDRKPAKGRAGGTILMRRGKTDQLGEGRISYLFPQTVAYIEEWLAAAQITIGFIFRHIRHVRREPWTKKPNDGFAIGPELTTDGVRDIIKARDTRSDADKAEDGELTGHSLRVGAAQDLAAMGRDIALIQQAGGWKTPKEAAKYISGIKAELAGMAMLADIEEREEVAATSAADVQLKILPGASPEKVEAFLALARTMVNLVLI